MNYWRQAADERYHAKSLAAIDAVARGTEDVEELVGPTCTRAVPQPRPPLHPCLH